MRAVLPWLVLLGMAACVHAQQAPIFLEPGHWSHDAIRRLDTAGLAPTASDHAVAPVTRQHARAVFLFAAARAAERGRPDLEAQARAYEAVLAAEADTTGGLAGARLRAGWTGARGEALGGDGFHPGEDWKGAQPVTDAGAAAIGLSAHGHLARWLSWSVDGGRLGGEWYVPAATVGVRAGPFDGWAGRRRLHYGVGHGGATVIGSGLMDVPDLAHRTLYAFDGVGMHVRDPFHFPSFLRFLGATRIEITAGRLDRSGRVERPYVVFGRLVGSPFSERFTLGVNRGAIFGGEGNPVTAARMLGLLVGMHGGDAGEFENQVFSVVARYRPPLVALPVAVYLEWGMDDTSGAVRDTPGVVAGLDAGPFPGLDALSFGVERTNFPESWRGKPPWYRNVFFRGSWADGGRLFAHPLGGHGTEWLARVRLDRPDLGLFAGAEAFTRERRHENLFSPERAGHSRGATASLEHRLRPGTGLRVDASLERGDGWTSRRMSLMLWQDLVRRRR
jgi:hypothetical protein